MADVPTDQIAYVDETGIDRYLYREYGRAKRGEPVQGLVSGHRYKRVGLVAACVCNDIIAPMQYDGTMSSALFEKWFEDILLPLLPERSVIVMDNATFHRKSRLTAITKNTGHTLVFLPPYSPELNPIEHFWSWLKRRLRKTLADFPSFDLALAQCFLVRSLYIMPYPTSSDASSQVRLLYLITFNSR